MLQYLHVKNLALIDEIEVEFQDGLNILTGETGAGKSIILGSVNLALGARYHKEILRPGADYGLVEITFQLEGEAQIQRLKDLDIFPEEGMVTLSRRLMPGKSISRINGETVSIAVLKEAACVLIDIHGQHEHQSLLYKKNHLGITDAYAKDVIAEEKQRTKESFRKYQKLKKEWQESVLDEAGRAKELDFLKFEAEEIRNADLRPGEDEELESLYRKMNAAKKISEGIEEAYHYTSLGPGNASDALSRAIRALSDASQYDEEADAILSQLTQIDSLLNDFNRDLSEYQKSCEFSEEEFYETESRLNEINRLKTKYGNQIPEILEYLKQREERIEVLQDYDRYLEDLRIRLEEAEKELVSASGRLSGLRKKQALLLEKEIEDGLRELNFEKVRFEIHFEETKEYTEEGTDEIEFRISMNPGQPARPLSEVASGGELSRIMLAIKTVMAKKDEIETLIFDEIDVGISGRTAQKVSEKMALIGSVHQVICITHLAQIAAMADHHFRIEKSVENGETRTSIAPLSEEGSVEELARILGGAKITDKVMESASEMKALAVQKKNELRNAG
ncbi:DNA repair protein RecN [uncultured Merdimonas sp.]|uniref:DNA repair protein RecN n=1 Tax=uncultured Merdimonas sp. TaxID=2023269 RepID=UPI003208B514